MQYFLKSFLTHDKLKGLFLGPYPIGKAARTSLPFRRALTAISRSCFKTISQSAPAAAKSNSTSSSNYVNSRGTFCLKLTNQWPLASAEMKKMGSLEQAFLVPSPQIPIFLVRSRFLSSYACYAGYKLFIYGWRIPFEAEDWWRGVKFPWKKKLWKN